MKFLIHIFISLAAAVCIAYLYAFNWDPVMKSHADALRLRAEIAGQIDQPKIIFIGGSSCAHSVRPDVFREYGFRCVNMGYHAGSGASFLIAQGMLSAKPGDLLVIAIEPELLLEDSDTSRIALVGGLVSGQPSLAAGEPFSTRSFSHSSLFFDIRPGGTRLLKQFGAALIGLDLGQFSSVDEFGRMNDSRSVASPASIPDTYDGITTDNRSLLESIVNYGEQNNIQVICAVPWQLFEKEDSEKAHDWHQQYISEISTILPVLDEGASNVQLERALFSDTNFHLTDAGSIKRSKSYAEALSESRLVYRGNDFHVDLSGYIFSESRLGSALNGDHEVK